MYIREDNMQGSMHRTQHPSFREGFYYREEFQGGVKITMFELTGRKKL